MESTISLTSGELAPGTDPLALFAQWFGEAQAAEPNDANAMALATADSAGLPNVRVVLMKDFGPEGFTFYTNTHSTKGTELAGNRQAAANFHWKSLRRQVRLRGTIAPVSDAAADAYFASRPRESQIGAWASQQSRPLESRAAFQAEIARFAAQFEGRDVSRPPHWSGYVLAPISIEFWADRPFRLHDRFVFTRPSLAEPYALERRFP